MSYPGILLFKSALSLLINPIFYLYALSICHPSFRLRPRHLWHLLPFGLLTLGLLPHLYLVNVVAERTFLEPYLMQPETIASLWIGEGQFVGYTAAVFIILKKSKQTYLHKHSATASITYTWLFQLTAILTVLHVVVIIKNGVPFTPYQHWFVGAEMVVGLNATCLLSWFVLKALYDPTLFRSMDSIPGPVRLMLVDKPSPIINHPAVTTPEIGAQLGRLKEHMEQAEPYLDPDLTIQNLATQLHLPVREVSTLINHHLGQHFFDFVNEYRILKAMRLLADNTHPQPTVLEILYAVGFNSKSSFNTGFKKYTGLTPTQYRSQVG
jgi:AraC-like DNA-binding protein